MGRLLFKSAWGFQPNANLPRAQPQDHIHSPHQHILNASEHFTVNTTLLKYGIWQGTSSLWSRPQEKAAHRKLSFQWRSRIAVLTHPSPGTI
jgi:hypothetical protein